MPCKIQNCGWMVVNPIRPNQNLRVFWKPVNLQDCVWENLYRIIMKTILHGRAGNSLQHYNFVHKFSPVLQVMKIPAAKAAVDKEWEKWTKFRRQESEAKKRWSMKQGLRAQKFISPHWWTYVIWKMLNWRPSTKKNSRSSCTPRWYCDRRFRVLCSNHWTRITSISIDSRQNHGYHLQIAGLRRTSSGRSIC